MSMWCNRPLKRLSTQPNCRLPPACRSWENVPHLGPMCCGTDRPHRRHQQSLNPRMVTLHRLFIISSPPIFHPTSSTQFTMTCSFIHDPSHVSPDLSFQKHPSTNPPPPQSAKPHSPFPASNIHSTRTLPIPLTTLFNVGDTIF